MGETYCGKSCSECSYREKTNCLGCKQGPGKQFGGECEIARCCRSKGHEVCETCGFRQSCGKLSERNNEPLNRQKELEAESKRREYIAKRSLVLGKWLWILFWLFIPSEIGSVMANKSIMTAVPGVYMIGCVLNVICTMAYGFILIRLRSEEDRYFSAGIYTLICAAFGILITMISNVSQSDTLMILISIPTIVVGLIGEYNEYMAHSVVISGVDDELSDNWEKLWKWFVGLMCGIVGSIILMAIIPLIGIIAILAAAIGLIIVGIMKLVYLYRTANVFRLYPKEILTVQENKSDTIK